MMKLIKTAVFFIFLAFQMSVSAQQVNGHWYGIGMLQSTKQYNAYLSEMVLQQKGKSVNGYLLYYFKDSLVKANLNGLYDDQTHKLNINPFPVMYYMSPNAKNSIDCFMSGNFTLLASKTESVLTGRLFGDEDHKYTVPDINLRLTKSNDTAYLVMKDDEPEAKKDTVIVAKTKPVEIEISALDAFNQRGKVVAKELLVINSTLKLEIYDNGEIDYDSVSLFLNNKRILPKSMLNHKAIRLTIELDPNLEVNELSMFAENLGMIPPNTAALILYDGNTRYETMLTSDLSKSATLRLRRKK
jgi:hypothetical protein